MSRVSHHQQRRTVRRIDDALALKTGLGVGAHRADIFRVGIGHDSRNSRCEQVVAELPDKAGAMALSDHGGLADELIDTAGGLRLRPKTLVPGAERVALDVAERLAAGRDNELIHVGICLLYTSDAADDLLCVDLG